MEEISQILLSALGIIITSLVAWLASKLTKLIDNKITDAKAKSMLNDAIGLVARCVKETSQTYVDDLKNKNLFDKEAKKEALEKAKQKVKTQIKAETQKYIEQNYNSFEEWLATTIESKLYDLKEKEPRK